MKIIDFETRSSLSLPKVGTERYLHTSYSDIVCMSWWQPGMVMASLWLPGNPFPFDLKRDEKVYAFNIQFDQRVWNYLGVEKYGLPHLHLDQCVDIMALCGRYGLPQKLENIGKMFNLQLQKMPITKRLMKKICEPPFKYTMSEFKKFLAYCLDDTNTLIELLQRLPATKLDEYHDKVWRMTVDINRKGLPVDVQSVAIISKKILEAREEANKFVAVHTDGAIDSLYQVARIKAYAEEHGVYLPDLQADTVDVMMVGDSIPDDVKVVLELRKEFGKSAVAKYQKLLDHIYKGRIHDNLRFYGAHPGRWSGLGFQAHNLFRGDKKLDMDELVLDLCSGKARNVMGASRNAIRGMVKAPKGKKFFIADYKSIENVLLAGVAGEDRTLQLYREGKDEYKDFASTWFRIPYGEVTNEQRTFCKPVILGAQYGLSGRGLLGYANNYGVDYTLEKGNEAVSTWRSTHPAIVRFWYQVYNACLAAIRTPRVKYQYRGVAVVVDRDKSGKWWMILTLPSGRNLFYYDPEVIKNHFDTDAPSYLTWVQKYNSAHRVDMSPGHITENITQAIAWDILVAGKFALIEKGIDVLLSVHDEIIMMVDESFNMPSYLLSLMCQLPEWAKGLPLSAEGEFSTRYKKI